MTTETPLTIAELESFSALAASKKPALVAAKARLDIADVQARLRELKRTTPRIAALTKVLVATRTATTPSKASGDLTRSERREAARVASTLSPATATDFSDAALMTAATHRSSPESDRKMATAELARRGFTVAPSGIISTSSRKA